MFIVLLFTLLLVPSASVFAADSPQQNGFYRPAAARFISFADSPSKPPRSEVSLALDDMEEFIRIDRKSRQSIQELEQGVLRMMRATNGQQQ